MVGQTRKLLTNTDDTDRIYTCKYGKWFDNKATHPAEAPIVPSSGECTASGIKKGRAGS